MEVKYNCLECGNPINNTEQDQRTFVDSGMCMGCYNTAMIGMEESKKSLKTVKVVMDELIIMSDSMTQVCNSMKKITENVCNLIEQLKKGE